MTFDEAPRPVPVDAARPINPTQPTRPGNQVVPVRPTVTAPPQPSQVSQLPAGWYPEPGKPGVLRYWNGSSWEEWRQPLVAAPTVAQAGTSTAAAYVLAIFLGHFGAHNFYLGRPGPAIAQLLLWFAAIFTVWILIGFIPLGALVIWWIVDLCCIPAYVERANSRTLIRPV